MTCLKKIKQNVECIIEEFGFNLLESKFSKENFGNARISVISGNLILIFYCDRSQGYICIADSKLPTEEYDIPLIVQWLNGSGDDVMEYDAQYDFLKQSIKVLEESFLINNYQETHSKLKCNRKNRMHRRLGF